MFETQLLKDTMTKQMFGIESQLTLNEVFFVTDSCYRSQR